MVVPVVGSYSRALLPVAVAGYEKSRTSPVGSTTLWMPITPMSKGALPAPISTGSAAALVEIAPNEPASRIVAKAGDQNERVRLLS